MSDLGDCITTRLLNQSTGVVQLRVDAADSIILVDDVVIRELLASGGGPHVRLEEGGMFTFGTPGLGEGRVTYQLGERHDRHTHLARRIEVTE